MSNLLLEHATDALLLETGDYLLLEGLVSGWELGAGWSIGSGIATCDGTQTTFTLMSQTLTAEIGIDYAVEFELNTRTAGSVSVEFEGNEVIAEQTVLGTYSVLVTPLTTAPELVFKGSFDFDGSVDNATVKRSWWLETNWIRGTLAIQGQSERQSPSSVNVKYKEPDDLTPNWQTKSAIRTFPDAASGLTPFIQTTLSLPGTQNLNEAYNKAVIKMQRMFDRIAVSYQTTDSGMYQRIGDVVQLLNSTRGADLRVWVESVKLIEPGRFQIEGIFYSELHFSNSSYGALFQCDATYELAINLDPIGYWPLYDDYYESDGTTENLILSDHSSHGNSARQYSNGGVLGVPGVLNECNNLTGFATNNGFGSGPGFREDTPGYISYKSSGTWVFIVKNKTNNDGRYMLLRWNVPTGTNKQKPTMHILNLDSDMGVYISTGTKEADGGIDSDTNGIWKAVGGLSKGTYPEPNIVIVRYDFSYVEPGFEGIGDPDMRVDVWNNGVKAGGKIWGGKGDGISSTGDIIDGLYDVDGTWNHVMYFDYWMSEETIAELSLAVKRNQSGYTP